MNKIYFRILLLALTFSLTSAGCSSLGVSAWEKSVLSKKSMQFNSDNIETTFNKNFYYSKEASSGGREFAGGGCGCN